MKKIEEQIVWYTQNADRKDDDLILENLKLINKISEKIEYSEDRIFIDKIISTFCEIMDIQRDVIEDLKSEAEQLIPSQITYNYVALPSKEALSSDEDFQIAFSNYLTNHVSKPLSSYTINDYLSRLKNLWKPFYDAHINGELPEELIVLEGKLTESVLANVYNYIEEIYCYVCMQMSSSSERFNEKRNWANAKAALNKFSDFKNYMSK